jgi:hypothetical protein
MSGGAWPSLVGGMICLVNSDNERDVSLLNSPRKILYFSFGLLRGTMGYINPGKRDAMTGL